jgi:hypothetical protein
MGRIAALEQAVADLTSEIGELRARLGAEPATPPVRDQASTASCGTERAWAPVRRAPASAFGFGKDVTG